MIVRVRADEVDPATDIYVNRPGRFAYRFPIHRVSERKDGRLTIQFGATHVDPWPNERVLVDRTSLEVDLTGTQ